MVGGARAFRAELLHREVNERILDVATRLFEVAEEERLWLVCECSRLGCSERLELRADAFRAVLGHPGRFVVLPGHEDASLETPVEEHEGYVVVEKPAGTGGAGREPV